MTQIVGYAHYLSDKYSFWSFSENENNENEAQRKLLAIYTVYRKDLQRLIQSIHMQRNWVQIVNIESSFQITKNAKINTR